MTVSYPGTLRMIFHMGPADDTIRSLWNFQEISETLQSIVGNADMNGLWLLIHHL